MSHPQARFTLSENEIKQAIREYLLNHYGIVPIHYFLNGDKTCDVRYVISKVPEAPQPRELRSETGWSKQIEKIKSRGVVKRG